METLVLDTSLLLAGKEPPPGRWLTTPEAAAEIKPGGKDARRFENWQEIGLQIRSASSDSALRVEETAMAAGNLGRLSDADLSLVGLALDQSCTLVSDDFTILDIASRLGIMTRTISTDGIHGTKDWRPRCSGCGRWFDAPQKRDECPVCGSAVLLKPVK